MLPPAGPPGVVGLMTGVPGLLAVPVRVAVSVTGLPMKTSGPADVLRSGFTGVTRKHSVAAESLDPGMPLAVSPL